jgi:Vps16, N-terminal region
MARGDDPFAPTSHHDNDGAASNAASPLTTAAGAFGSDGNGDGGDGGGDGGGGMLADAVAACVAAAAAQLDAARQKALLRAAAYGKGFLGAAHDSEDFVAGGLLTAERRWTHLDHELGAVWAPWPLLPR